ncbi:ATP-binding cassette domain-containing protein [Nocardia pseudovaccinii]|uniref:ATP-binding cassette domain-containing protein n=1 Tax=Nocardia pseudovaccinii TaxID=189540 RepID=UPI0007A44BE5|nr:ATP-binding cassette domain-containing protein [Nocardia pseudovaccinii]
MASDTTTAILTVEGLRKSFEHHRGKGTGRPTAVDGVGFSLRAGQTLAIVGESGAGKSTTGRMILRLIEPDAGTIHFDGVDIRSLRAHELRRMRARMQMIFQDPYSSLNPKVTVGAAVAEPLRFHTDLSRRERAEEALRLLERVGIRPDQIDRFPYEMSGGQLQRIAIARALATKPYLVVCDEPTASLDVSIQAQVINLLLELQAERGMSYLFISHNLSLVRTFADHIAVMRNGQIVEAKPADELFDNPTHPYTRQLLSAVPVPDPHVPGLLAPDGTHEETHMQATGSVAARDRDR